VFFPSLVASTKLAPSDPADHAMPNRRLAPRKPARKIVPACGP
jgi:hypothetical protein